MPQGRPTGGRPTAADSRLSLWALFSLLCGVSVVCPVASLVAPLLGVVAIREIRRKPHRTGMKLAVTGIVIGLAATAGWGVLARWWHVEARAPMLEGPLAPLQAGQVGNVAMFKSAFTGDGADAPDAEARAFLDEVGGRYGRVLGSQQLSDEAAAVPPGSTEVNRPRIGYMYVFESGPVEAEAGFVVFADGNWRPVLKFAWLVLRDEELGDLVYPASAADAAADRAPIAEP